MVGDWQRLAIHEADIYKKEQENLLRRCLSQPGYRAEVGHVYVAVHSTKEEDFIAIPEKDGDEVLPLMQNVWVSPSNVTFCWHC